MLTSQIFTLSLRYMLHTEEPQDSQIKLQHALKEIFSNETFLTTMNAIDCQAAIHIDEELFPYVDIIAVLYASVNDDDTSSVVLKDYVDTYAQHVLYDANTEPASLVQRKIFC